MFLHVFFTLTFLHRALCDISCHICSQEDNTFQFHITSENIPTQLRNCSIETGQIVCLADIAWKQSPTLESSIRLGGVGPYLKSKFRPHSIEINTYFPDHPERSQVRHFVRYICDTDRCNQPANLKPLLESLTWDETLDDLRYLVESNGTFDGRWCQIFSKSSDSLPRIDPTDCKQCFISVTEEGGMKTVLLTCHTSFARLNRFSHEITFDLKDRTRSEGLTLECQLPDCNSMSNINQIQQKNKVNFDINKFLQNTSSSSSTTYSDHFSKLIFMFVSILFAKYSC